MQEEFSCSSINREIKKYSDYKYKIDDLFTQLSKKDENSKNKYFTKIDNLTKKYLDILDKVKQKKLYTIIGYLKCENESKLSNLSNDYLNKVSYEVNIENKKMLNSNNYYDVKVIYLIINGKKIYIDESDGNIENVNIIKNKFLVYDWISTSGAVKRAYNIDTVKKIGQIAWGVLNKNNSKIYACDVMNLGGYNNFNILDLESGKQIKYSTKKECENNIN